MTAPGAPYPAPQATDQPERPTLPESLRLALELWVLVIVCELVSRLAAFSQQRDEVFDTLVDRYQDSPEIQPSKSMATVAMVIVIVLLVVVAAVLLKLVYDGRGWARLVLGVLCTYIAITVLIAMFGIVFLNAEIPVDPSWAMVPNIIAGVAALGAMIGLLHRDSVAYCGAMAAYRKERGRR